MVEWKKCYLDLFLVPAGLLIVAGYHAWLWRRVRTQPFSTIIGTNAAGRRFWVNSIIQDNEKKNILAVQTLRNTIMGSTLMATTSILLCSGLAAVLSSTYSIKKPLGDSVYGAHGEFMLALKYVVLLSFFIFSFLCHSLSIRFINQVNFLINSPQHDPLLLLGISPAHQRNGNGNGNGDPPCSCVVVDGSVAAITPEYISQLLDRGMLLNTFGNRLFYTALPLLLWIFGPVLVFLSCLSLVPLLYNLDILVGLGNATSTAKANDVVNII